jgi:hypothetical protein
VSSDLDRLLSLASDPLGEPLSSTIGACEFPKGPPRKLIEQLQEILSSKNGFYAFESALLLRPLHSEAAPVGIVQWNAPNVWKSQYHRDLASAVFFAEDAFGFQFCLQGNGISSFDPETAEFKAVAPDLASWCKWILEDHKARTGWPIAHFWQLRNGALKPGMRLLPKIPFVLGGQFSPEHLSAVSELEGIRFRADIANQIADCPDGSKVVLRIERGKNT